MWDNFVILVVSIFDRLMSKVVRNDKPEMGADLRRTLWSIYEEDVLALESLLDCYLYHWRVSN